MLLPFAKIIRSEEETIKIAGNFARLLKPGDVVILTGNLGSGKTFFVRYAVKQFGIDSVSSPTFAIVNEYDGSMKIYHFDFYRIKNSAELFDIGFNDYLNDSEAVSFIEWGEMFPEMLPATRYEVDIILYENLSRAIAIKKNKPIKIAIRK